MENYISQIPNGIHKLHLLIISVRIDWIFSGWKFLPYDGN